jgi:beta-lactamase class D
LGVKGEFMMIRILVVCLALVPSALSSAGTWQERADWARFFTDAGVDGTIAIADERAKAHWVYGEARAGTRYMPASTFKIPHALFALDAGIVRDEFQVFSWDGVRRDIAS